ncbi:MAG TPA: cytochrome ubiquinol oxidase subunit I [Pirellulales bacterium]|jgi:cytochrome d ubiquinol oxidase subunit I|nr:cytochrome ubiquinol oxidase subunit I [Pirellulales bacterium]
MDEISLAAAGYLDANLLAARWQMAITLGAHIILAALGVGMPVLLLIAEWRALRAADPVWRALARRWSKAFAVLFAVGAISGTVLSFELGLLWPDFMRIFGPVIGFPFAMEGFAFFLEAIFVGIYLYGWERLSPWAHWWCGVPVAISGAASAWFVVTVNAWMNSPQGFRLEGDRAVDIDPIAAMLNPATGPQTTHMLVAAYVVSGFLVASVYATALLRGRNTLYVRRGLALSLSLAAVMSCVQLVAGDWAAQRVAATQPIKLASLEGQFKTEAGAPLRIGGLPDPRAGTTRYAIEIPGMLSWLAYRDRDAVVEGLDSFAEDQKPPVVVVHLAFQTMVASGMLMLLVAAIVLVSLIGWRRLPTGKVFLIVVVPCGPVSVLALEAGWVVTEVGRQPWIVHGVARTADMVTASPYVGWLLAITSSLYGLIALGTIVILRQLARDPLPEDARGS